MRDNAYFRRVLEDDATSQIEPLFFAPVSWWILSLLPFPILLSSTNGRSPMTSIIPNVRSTMTIKDDDQASAAKYFVNKNRALTPLRSSLEVSALRLKKKGRTISSCHIDQGITFADEGGSASGLGFHLTRIAAVPQLSFLSRVAQPYSATCLSWTLTPGYWYRRMEVGRGAVPVPP